MRENPGTGGYYKRTEGTGEDAYKTPVEEKLVEILKTAAKDLGKFAEFKEETEKEVSKLRKRMRKFVEKQAADRRRIRALEKIVNKDGKL